MTLDTNLLIKYTVDYFDRRIVDILFNRSYE